MRRFDMKTFLALLAAAASACATGSSSNTHNTAARAAGSAGDTRPCAAPMVSAVLARGTDVYDTADPSNAVKTRITEDTPVCASSTTAGFGYRRVQLANGKFAYVSPDDLSTN